MDRVAVLGAVLVAFGVLYLVVEVRRPSGPRVNPRAVSPPPTVMVIGDTARERPALPSRVDVHHHHHLLSPSPRRPVEVVDGEVVASELLGAG